MSEQRYFLSVIKHGEEQLIPVGRGLTPESALSDGYEWFSRVDLISVVEVAEELYLRTSARMDVVRAETKRLHDLHDKKENPDL